MTFRERQERRLARRREWAAGREAKSAAAFDRAHNLSKDIPLGQPILVGHHSERRARRDAKQIEDSMFAGVDHAKMAERHDQAADGIERQLERSIYSDDDDAIERLEERIAMLEAERDRVKAFNASCRKGTRDMSLLDERQQRDIISTAQVASYQLGKGGGFPAYHLALLGANIKRNRQRLATLANPRSAAPRAMFARYAGTCEECGGAVAKGAAIVYSRAERTVKHEECYHSAPTVDPGQNVPLVSARWDASQHPEAGGSRHEHSMGLGPPEGGERSTVATFCKHRPDTRTLSPADGAPGIVDVLCLECGRSGSVRVALDEIQWGDEEEFRTCPDCGREIIAGEPHTDAP